MEAKQLVTLDAWEGFQCENSKQMYPFMMVIHSFAMTRVTAVGALSPMGPPPQPLSSYTMVSLDGGRCCCCHTCFFNYMNTIDDYGQLDQQNKYHCSCPPNPFVVLNHDSTEPSSLPYLALQLVHHHSHDKHKPNRDHTYDLDCISTRILHHWKTLFLCTFCSCEHLLSTTTSVEKSYDKCPPFRWCGYLTPGCT